MQDVSLVLDIGKSHTRLFLFSEELRVVHETRVKVPLIEGEDGLFYDDVEQVWNWFLRQLKIIGEDRHYVIRAINVCSFGATVAHIDENGTLAHPVIAYTSPSPNGLDEAYYEWVDSIPGKNVRLGTPTLPGFLNVAKQLFYLKNYKPEVVANIRFTFFLPQYFIYKLTGAIVSEPSCYGCHTGLWDFEMQAPSFHSLNGLDWLSKMPKLNNPVNLCQLYGEYKRLIKSEKPLSVGAGIHDSTAALMAYWQATDEDFVLLTTGSWNIGMNPFASFSLSEDQLSRGTRYYLTPHLQNVRASRLFAGREHEHQLARIDEHFGTQPVTPEKPLEEYLKKFFANPAQGMLTPKIVYNTGPFPNLPEAEWDLSVFDTAEEAYARLCLDLAVLTMYCLEQVNQTRIPSYIMDGKFSQNPWFVKIMGMLAQPNDLYISNLDEAAATGAAMAVHHFWAPDPDIRKLIQPTKVEVEHLAGLRVYAEWLLSYYDELNG